MRIRVMRIIGGSKRDRNTLFTIGGEEYIGEVHYFLQPPEPDVGLNGWSVELESVKVDGVEMIGSMEDDEQQALVDSILSGLGGGNDY